MSDIPVQTKIDTLLLLAKVDERKRALFYEALLEGYVYATGTLEAEEGATEGVLHLRYFQGEGRWILPIFTQLSFLQQAIPPETPVVTIRGKELFQRVDEEATVVLNLGQDVNKSFSPEEVKEIRTGTIFTYEEEKK